MKFDIEKIKYSSFKKGAEYGTKNFDYMRNCLPYDLKWNRINKYSCWYTRVGLIVYLKSYNTIVADYDITLKTIRVFSYYSATTCQHVTNFIRLMRDMYHVSTVLYLYERSDRIAFIDYDANTIYKWDKRLK